MATTIHPVRVIAVTVVGLFLCAQTASAVTLVTPNGQVAQPYQHWADRAKVPTVSGVVRMVPDTGPCAAPVVACSVPSTIYYDSGLTDDFVLWAELGHQFSYAVLDDSTRVRFARLLGLNPADWWLSDQDWYYSGEEVFADEYAICAAEGVDPPPGGIQGSGESRAQHRARCGLIEHAGIQAGIWKHRRRRRRH